MSNTTYDNSDGMVHDVIVTNEKQIKILFPKSINTIISVCIKKLSNLKINESK